MMFETLRYLLPFARVMYERKLSENIAMAVLKIFQAGNKGHLHCLLGIWILVIEAKKIRLLLQT